MISIRFAFFAAALVAATPVAAFPAVTTDNAILRAAPSSNASQVGTVPAGTTVDIQICFDQGAYCAVVLGTATGFVAGDYLRDRLSGSLVSAMERNKWQTMQPIQVATTDTGSLSDIVAWGDSLTDGAGAPAGQSYTDQAAAMLGGRLIANEGIGGQTSTSIAARMNAVPTFVTVDGDAIPASGRVAVVDRSALPITNQYPPDLEATLCGVAGRLALAAEAKLNEPVPPYVFERAAAGEAANCPPGSRVTFADAVTYKNRIAWLWLGRNGADPGRTIGDDIAAAVESLGHDRYLVGSILAAGLDAGSPAARIRDMNAELKRQYGQRYVDVLSALIAAADSSSDDQSDAAAGFVPRSLLADSIHLTQRGYAIVAKAFADATLANAF